MPARVEQERGRMRMLLALLAPFRKPLVMAAIGGFVAGVLATVSLRGFSGGGWGLTSPGIAFTPDEVQAARRNARYASQVLANFLGDGPRAYDWRAYLRFDELQAALGDGEYPPPPVKSDPALLSDVVDRLSQNHPGLELQQFAGLRSALSAYLKMLEMSEPAPERPPMPDSRMATTPQRRYR